MFYNLILNINSVHYRNFHKKHSNLIIHICMYVPCSPIQTPCTSDSAGNSSSSISFWLNHSEESTQINKYNLACIFIENMAASL